MGIKRPAKTNDEIYALLVSMQSEMDKRHYIDEQFLVLAHELSGNGKPGFKAIRDRVMEWESTKRVVVGIALTNIAALFFAAIVWFVRIYPVIERIQIER